jgi:hypothetical protein
MQSKAKLCCEFLKKTTLSQIVTPVHDFAPNRTPSCRKPLLTGWSLVRIRPGEPKVIDFTIFFRRLALLPTTLPRTLQHNQ